MKKRYLLFCGPEERPPRSRAITISFRAPRWLSEEAHAKARAEDLSFSQFVRRGIRRQAIAVGISIDDECSHAVKREGCC
jgi:hypothetical protein